ncbi:hypothetical protein A6A25_23090 [Saccharothrix sp. CB00851]|nr:hypothetical protein A6A25_23090 [Saccharothrix sp. CB00851]
MLHGILSGHEPYPALVVDRRWNLLLANQAVDLLLEGAAPELLRPPVNVLRLAVHPNELARRLVNPDEVRDHLLNRLAREASLTGDAELVALHDELARYGTAVPTPSEPAHEIALPVRVRDGDRVLSFLSTITTFGTALDVVLAELTVEAFYPADPQTVEALHARRSERNPAS